MIIKGLGAESFVRLCDELVRRDALAACTLNGDWYVTVKNLSEEDINKILQACKIEATLLPYVHNDLFNLMYIMI